MVYGHGILLKARTGPKLVSVSNTMSFHKIFLSLETPNREACQISQQLKNSKHQDYTNTSQFRCHIVC